MSENEVRAIAVREAARYLERIHRPGLVTFAAVLMDLEAVAGRMEQGMTARGSTRVVAEEPEWEYGISSGHGSVNYVGSKEFVDARIKSFEKAGAPLRDGERIVRRRKVGLWVPVSASG